jgi:methyl-accepting chemotaxis protein
MEWFKSIYDFIERKFFFTLSRKIIGNIGFLFLFQIANLYLFSNWLSSPDIDEGTMKMVSTILFIVSALSFIFTIFYMHHLIVKPVKALLQTLNNINHTKGDLSTRLPKFSHDEFTELSTAYNTFANNLTGLIKQVYLDAQSATKANQTVTSLVNESYQQADQQKTMSDNITDAVTQVSQSIFGIVSASEQVTSTNQKNQGHVQNANQILSSSQQQIEKITQLLSHFSSTVKGLQDNADNVRNILKVVEGFADQTNLLALNAAIEAARAGEAGRGFAIVADEVRSLSAKVSDATQQISNFLNQMETLVSETHTESTTLITESGNMEQSIKDTSSIFELMIRDFEENVTAFGVIMESVTALEVQQNNTADFAAGITSLSNDIQQRLQSTTEQASKAQSMASSTQKGLGQFVE